MMILFQELMRADQRVITLSETFVLHLLSTILENQQRNFKFLETHHNLEMLFMNGFDQFQGPTLIEIKFDLTKSPFRMFLDRYILRFANEYIENKIKMC